MGTYDLLSFYDGHVETFGSSGTVLDGVSWSKSGTFTTEWGYSFADKRDLLLSSKEMRNHLGFQTNQEAEVLLDGVF